MFYHVSVFSSFLLLNSILLYGLDILFIDLLVGEHLDYFYSMVIMNNPVDLCASLYMDVYFDFFWIGA